MQNPISNPNEISDQIFPLLIRMAKFSENRITPIHDNGTNEATAYFHDVRSGLLLAI